MHQSFVKAFSFTIGFSTEQQYLIQWF